MEYTELKEQRQKKYDDLFSKLGVFWAFSNKQFDEGRKANPLQEGEKYATLGGGGFVRNSKAEELLQGMKDIDNWFKTQNKAIKADQKKKEDMIRYELANYESWYTGDISRAYEVLKEEGITREEVLAVYKKYYKVNTANL